MTNEIEFKGELLPIKTDFSVISKVCAKFNLKFQDFTNCIESPEQLTYLFHQSLLRGHKLEGRIFQYKEEDVEDILSDNYADFMGHFNNDCLRMATKKSDLKTVDETKKKDELTIEYLFALFVSKFHYSKDQFYQLTPVEVQLILDVHSQDEDHFYSFLLNEFRTSNYYTIKSAFGDTKHIRTPQSLYALPFEREQIEKSRQRAIEKANAPLPDEDIAVLKKLGMI